MKSYLSRSIDGIDRYYNEFGLLHREDGPAIIYSDGMQCWYYNGQKHRENGPAVIHPDEVKSWWLHGKRHRLDGPAIERPAHFSLKSEWWYQGKHVECSSQEEFEKLIALKAFW